MYMNLNLHMGEFKDNLLSANFKFDGVHYVFKFPNRYGASIIKHMGSYGHESDLWELAVIRFGVDDEWGLTYDTEITDDVIGWLDEKEVLELLGRIRDLSE